METHKGNHYVLFQFTPLREGRHHSLLFLPLPSPFQFTPLREGRRINRVVRAADVNFNSRPSARGDKIVETDCMLPIISIHAPPRGATELRSKIYEAKQISIHAPPRGATPAQKSITPVGDYFNSRPSARGDAHHLRRPNAGGYFNSRPSARGDIDQIVCLAAQKSISIHAPPRGATARSWRLPATWRFQFTPLREGRQGVVRAAQQARISIHAPPRGATIPDDVDGSADFISIHAPPRGATPARFSLRASCTYFNSRPSARGDGCAFFCVPPAPIFQFTPLREGRRWLPRTGTNPPSISIHAPPRGATATALLPASEVRISIHAPPRGATRGRCAVRADDIFQFTPLREGRPSRSGAAAASR